LVEEGRDHAVDVELRHALDAESWDGSLSDIAARSWSEAVEQLQRRTSWFRPGDLSWSRVADTVWIDQNGGPAPPVGVVASSGDTAWLAKVDFLLRSDRLPAPPPPFTALRQLAEASGGFWAFERLAILVERPVAIHRDGQARLHCATGAAVEYPGGFTAFAWHGERVPRRVVMEAETITVHDIDAERDDRLRLIMVERFGGWDRYLAASAAQLVQRDECGALWRKRGEDGESIVLVELTNASAQPDGTRTSAVLRVPPSVRTARAAVAWTFHLEEAAYAPIMET